MTPIVDGLATEFAGQVDVLSLNAAEPAVARQQRAFGVQGHPSFVVLDVNGSVTAAFFGPQEAETLRTAMTAVRPAPD